MRRLRSVHPLYWLALVLFIVTVLVSALVGSTTTSARSASVYDSSSGGAAAFRRFLEAMGAKTVTLQGDTFTVDPDQISVLFILVPSELVTTIDAQAVRRFVQAGGTAIIASEHGIFDRSLLDVFDVHLNEPFGAGTYNLSGIAFADPPARSISLDQGSYLTPGPGRVAIASGGGRPIAALGREGRGTFVVVGSVAPFLAGQLGSADNGRFGLALAAAAIGSGRAVAFDEYHHGVHPSADVLALITKTWPGRALGFTGLAAFAYLVATSRRLGRPIPLDPRPPRSSLDYIRGFAGLVRRSGHGEIARRRLRRELRTGLARGLGLDPETSFERTLSELGASDRQRAADARAADDALGRPLRDDALLRTVREIGRLTGTEPRREV